MADILQETLDVLRSGGTILYPTDTIWGIGCDARNKEAVERVYELKQRPDSKSLITLLGDPSQLNRHVRQVPDVAWDLVESVVDPTTIIYPGAINLAPNVIAADGSIAIRIPGEGFWVHQLLRKFRAPLVSTSANISGQPSPKSFADIDQAVLDGVDYVVDLPTEPSASKPSTIIKIEINGEFKFIRK